MNNLPRISISWAEEQDDFLEERANRRELLAWLDEKLSELEKSNPELLNYISARANKFAVGALAVPNAPSIAFSSLLETVRLLALLDKGLAESEGRRQELDKLEQIFKGVQFEGLDDEK